MQTEDRVIPSQRHRNLKILNGSFNILSGINLTALGYAFSHLTGILILLFLLIPLNIKTMHSWKKK